MLVLNFPKLHSSSALHAVLNREHFHPDATDDPDGTSHPDAVPTSDVASSAALQPDASTMVSAL